MMQKKKKKKGGNQNINQSEVSKRMNAHNQKQKVIGVIVNQFYHKYIYKYRVLLFFGIIYSCFFIFIPIYLHIFFVFCMYACVCVCAVTKKGRMEECTLPMPACVF